MNQEEFDIIKAFYGISVELTINQLSKSLKKSYASTNKYAHELIKKEILKQKEVGHSILCSLNFQNKNTIASLVFISMSESDSTFKNEVVVSYKGKILNMTSSSLKKSIQSFDFSNLKVLSGHEEFWNAAAEVAR